MKKNIMIPQLAEKIQDDIFRKMSAERKIKIVSKFFKFAKKLNKLNDMKINGDRRFTSKNSKNIGRA